MSEAQLSVLNYALLALLYLFFGRVLWAVWSEVRGPRLSTAPVHRGAAAVSDAPAPPRRRETPRRLLVLEPKVRRGSAYPLDREIVIGRGDSCDIQLPDDTFASQLHARIWPEAGVLWVEDLGSTNGSALNGDALVEQRPLAKGDRLQVGNTVFEAD